MSEDRDGFQFNLIARRFIHQRWETDLGQRVLEEIVQGIRRGVELRAILDPYVLKDEANSDPWGHPFYPPAAMTADAFWVINNDDLRGASFYRQQFSGTPSLEKKALSYATFFDCDLSGADLYQVEFSSARLEQCRLAGAAFVRAGGFDTIMIRCDVRDANMSESGWIDVRWDGSDLRDCFWADATIRRAQVDYQTLLDIDLRRQQGQRLLQPAQIPDILRAFRRAYTDVEIWDEADRFLRSERRARRRHVLAKTVRWRNPRTVARWLSDAIADAVTGYGTQLGRVVWMSAALIGAFATLYWWAGVPKPSEDPVHPFLQALYFSLTSFATLGFGDLAYDAQHPWLRLLSTIEALCGAMAMAVVVTVLARKWFR